MAICLCVVAEYSRSVVVLSLVGRLRCGRVVTDSNRDDHRPPPWLTITLSEAVSKSR